MRCFYFTIRPFFLGWFRKREKANDINRQINIFMECLEDRDYLILDTKPIVNAEGDIKAVIFVVEKLEYEDEDP